MDFQYDAQRTTTITDVDEDGLVSTTTYDNNDTFAWEHLYIELGGFRIGKTDSLFATFTNYAGGVINDGLVPFSPFGTIQMAYTYKGANGLSVALALEQGDEGDGGITEDYVPYVVGGVSLTQDWGSVGLVAGYDTQEEEVAIKARLDVNITETAKVFVMGAYDTGGDVPEGDDSGKNYYAPWGGDWAIWGGASVALNTKATFNTQVSYDDAENFGIVANIAYELVPGFRITPEIAYYDNLDQDDADSIGGMVRFQRNF
jgi:Porin subfamily